LAQSFFSEEKYKKGDFKLPKDDVSPEKKTENGRRGSAWFKKYFEAMYSEYVKDLGGIPYSRRSDFALYRLYSDGNQPSEKYMDILAPKNPNTQEREGYMNISWDIVSVAPKFKRIFVGNFEKVEHEIQCSAINDKAVSEKEDAKWNIWARKQLADYFKELDAKIGVSTPEPEFVPDTIQELEMFMEESFKLKTEMAMEMGIEYAFYLSNWRDVKKRMLEDAFTLGVMACQDYVDPIDGKIKVKYIDPARLITRYTSDPHFRNLDHWGYIDEITISELRQIAPELTEEEIFDIAKNYCNFGGNSAIWNWEFNMRDYYSWSSYANRNNQELPYDNYRVNVMFAEMISSDTEVYQKRVSGDGALRTFKEDYTFQKTDSEKRKVERHKYQTVYKGWWVLGTDYMYNCGKQYDIPRPENKRPALSINIYRDSYKSILASIIPNLDSFQLSWLKLQNAKAMASPSGLSIEMGVLENISIDGKTLNPLEILTIRRQTGDQLYKAMTHHSEYNGGGGAPITELEGGMGRQLQEFISLMEYDLNMIRQQTGMNEVIDSSAQNPNLPVGTSKLAVEAANNALQPIYSGYVSIKESTAKKIALRYQIKAVNGNIKGYLPSLGNNVIKVFEITKDVSYDDYAIKIQMKPTDEMKQAIRLTVQKAVQLGPKNGGISDSDALYIEDRIQNGNLKYARLFLSYKEKQYQKDAEKMQSDNMAANGQNMQAQEQMKSQAAVQLLQLQQQGEIQRIQAESQAKKEEGALSHQYKMAEIQAQGQIQVASKVVEKSMEPDKDDSKS